MMFVFSAHAKDRLVKRNLSEQDVVDAIVYSSITIKKQGKFYASKNIGRGTIEVVYEKTEKYISVITVYWVV